MTRRCTVCDHPDRSSIDSALVAGASYRVISGRFPGSSTSALQRHAANHVPAAVAQAQQARAVAHGDDLLDEIRDLKAHAMGVLTRAEAAEDLRAAVSAIREARGCVELLAKMCGELRDGQTVNIIMTPEWGRARGVAGRYRVAPGGPRPLSDSSRVIQAPSTPVITSRPTIPGRVAV